MIPSSEQILTFYDAMPNHDKIDKGFRPRSEGRIVFCEWFLQAAGDSFTTRKGIVRAGRTPVRLRGLYLLEKALGRRRRAQAKASA